ncbi:MAG: hypothetical protein FJ100_07595 [Deltaproteobacteria bacterium]|nr:hypothetical protein [Deltaproteobacteria bacterium]
MVRIPGLWLAALLPLACTKAPPAEMTAAPLPTPVVPVAAPVPAGATPTGAVPDHPALQQAPAAAAGQLPAGHPPIGAGDPAALAAPQAELPDGPTFTVPAAWQSIPPRPMLYKVYALPKEAGDAEAAELTVSFLGAGLPLDMNVTRWCGQFQLAAGSDCASAAKQTPVAGARHPSTLVEIVGAFLGSMGDPAGAVPKAGWKMATVAVGAPTRTWYFKMVGPRAAVERWQAEAVRMAQQVE